MNLMTVEINYLCEQNHGGTVARLAVAGLVNAFVAGRLIVCQATHAIAIQHARENAELCAADTAFDLAQRLVKSAIQVSVYTYIIAVDAFYFGEILACDLALSAAQISCAGNRRKCVETYGKDENGCPCD